MAREILGHIDCPTCGTAKGMRITHDKNGEPFGYCEDGCFAQLRIGGKARRVAAFLKMYPWAAGKAAPAPAADPKPETAPKAEPAAKATPPAPAKPAAKKTANPFDFLLNQGAKA